MTTLTTEQTQAIETYLEGRHIPAGLGTEDEACSIAAINLVLAGELTEDIPACMSEVIGQWMIVVQDAMPDAMRNSAEWRALLPLAAGTGRKHEQERLDLILSWMWGVVLPDLSVIARQRGFGDKWEMMLTERTAAGAARAAEAAAAEAAEAAWAAWAAMAAGAAEAAWAAMAAGAAEAAAVRAAEAAMAAEAAGAAGAVRAAEAAWAAEAATAATAATAVRAARAVRAAEAAAAEAAEAAGAAGAVRAVRAAEAAWAAWAAGAAAWDRYDPVGLLRRLVEVGS